MAAVNDLQFWVNPYPFCFGVIQAHPKISTVYLKKVVAYARSKGQDGGFPLLKWNVWKHMAVNKMLLSEDIAWMYFETFNSICERTRDQRFQEAEKLQQCYESGDKIYMLKNNFEVNTYEFVIYLYIQQSAKISLRTSLVGEEWPGTSPRSRSPSPDLIEGARSSSNIFDENTHRNFFLNNLTEILELLRESPKSGTKGDSIISIDAVKALEFIVKGYNKRTKSLTPLSSAVTRQRYQMKSGYSKESQTFTGRLLEDWIRTAIGENPFGVTACVATGLKPKWCIPKAANGSMKKARICSNGSEAPSKNKINFFTQCSNQTIARESRLFNDSYVKFHRSHNSYFYLLSPLRFVSIEKCQNSTFVLGPVSNAIRITGCDNITVITPCRLIVISLSKRVNVFTATPTRPIIVSDNSSGKESGMSVTMAPYHTYYSRLEDHLGEAGLVVSPQSNQWRNPICINHASPSATLKSSSSPGLPRRRTDGSNNLAVKAPVYYSIIDPVDFYTFNIPFFNNNLSSNSPNRNSVGTTTIPWPLPKEYDAEIKKKNAKIADYKKSVVNSNLTKEERRAFRKRVEEEFTKWLEETGNKKQVDDLVELTRLFERDNTAAAGDN